MITLYSFAPEKLNLNGDQANLLVLQKRLQWLGVDSRITPIHDVDGLAAIKPVAGEFLLVGHGSKAAMASIPNHDQIRAEVIRLAESGMPGLAVGSGYELLQPIFSRIERRSEYANLGEQAGLPELFGYVNTDTDMPEVDRLAGDFVLSFVHGPVLAKTPQLADWFIERLGVKVASNANSTKADAFAAESNRH